MGVTKDFSFTDFIREGTERVMQRMDEVGKLATQYNIDNGSYHNVTGRLRASNKYEVSADGLRIMNDAPYASIVEARGRMVASEGALYAERLLNETEW